MLHWAGWLWDNAVGRDTGFIEDYNVFLSWLNLVNTWLELSFALSYVTVGYCHLVIRSITRASVSHLRIINLNNTSIFYTFDFFRIYSNMYLLVNTPIISLSYMLENKTYIYVMR
jgi:hypothetical protein